MAVFTVNQLDKPHTDNRLLQLENHRQNEFA